MNTVTIRLQCGKKKEQARKIRLIRMADLRMKLKVTQGRIIII